MFALCHFYGWTPDVVRSMRISDISHAMEFMGEEKRQQANSMTGLK